jgi:hypothetical protein
MTPYLKNALRLMSGEELLLLRIIWGEALRPDLDREIDRRANTIKLLPGRLPKKRVRATGPVHNSGRLHSPATASP